LNADPTVRAIFSREEFMQIEKLHTPEEVVAECAVIIDVLRAFTTAAFAFSAGAHKIIPVSCPNEALHLKRQNGDYLLIGEVQGKPIPGFDFGNSPTEIKHLDLRGKTIVQRTSAGTQGIIRSSKSRKILISSFVVAEATCKRILNLNPGKVSFVVTGKCNGDEDLALADYLESKLKNNSQPDATTFIQRVIFSPEGSIFSSSQHPYFPLSDLRHAISVDLFPFAMELWCDGSLSAIYPVDEFGKITIQRQ
jgi:2-phosphosulfolactate phosphatase